MFLRRFTDFILQSRMQAILVACALAVVPVIGSISIVIAALVTLRKGQLEGAFVVIAATLGSLLQYVIYPAANESNMLMVGIFVLIASNVLTWLFAVILRRYQNWSLTLEIALVVGVMAVFVLHLIYPEIQGWWQTQLSNYLAQATSVIDTVKPDAETIALQAELVNVMKRYATGLVMASVLFNALLQVLIARWWQAVIFNPGGLREELYRVRLSYATAALFMLGLALSFWGVEVVIDAMPVLLMVFFVAGLSLIHCIAGPWKLGWVSLILIYLAIMWLFPWSIAVVALFALVDTIVNVRQKIHEKFN